MRAQLSLELLLYLALAGLAFATAIGAVSGAYSRLGGNVDGFALVQFADTINTAMLENGAFSANIFLPSGLCGAEAEGDSMVTDHGAIYFVYDVNLTKAGLCPDGAYSDLVVTVKDGVAYFNKGQTTS